MPSPFKGRWVRLRAGEASVDSGVESTGWVCILTLPATACLRDDTDLCDVLRALVSSCVKP